MTLPSIAGTTPVPTYAEGVAFSEEGENELFNFNEEEMRSFRNILDSVIGSVEDDPSIFGLWETLQTLLTEIKDPTLRDRILDLLQGLTSNDGERQGKRVIVFSHGRTLLQNPLKKFKMHLIKPSTFFWYYSGDFDKKVSSKTFIIDPRPMDVKVLDGRQVGLMRRFVGIYLYVPVPSMHQCNVFFLGYAYQAVGLDLSPATR